MEILNTLFIFGVFAIFSARKAGGIVKYAFEEDKPKVKEKSEGQIESERKIAYYRYLDSLAKLEQ